MRKDGPEHRIITQSPMEFKSRLYSVLRSSGVGSRKLSKWFREAFIEKVARDISEVEAKKLEELA